MDDLIELLVSTRERKELYKIAVKKLNAKGRITVIVTNAHQKNIDGIF
jgi:hypothetical protein